MVPDEERLIEAIEALGRLVASGTELRTAKVLVCDDRTATAIEQILNLSGLEWHELNHGQAAEPPVKEVTTAKADEDKRCKFCGRPIGGRAEICGSSECKKAQKNEYNQRYAERRKAPGEKKTPFPVATGEASEEAGIL